MTRDEIRGTLRLLAESLPVGTAVPVSREWLLELTGAGESERRLLTPAQAAARANVAVAWFYRRKKNPLPFVLKLSHRKIAIDAGAFEKWLAGRTGS